MTEALGRKWGLRYQGKVGVQIPSCQRYDKLPGMLQSLYLPLHSEHGSQGKDMAADLQREVNYFTVRRGQASMRSLRCLSLCFSLLLLRFNKLYSPFYLFSNNFFSLLSTHQLPGFPHHAMQEQRD